MQSEKYKHPSIGLAICEIDYFEKRKRLFASKNVYNLDQPKLLHGAPEHTASSTALQTHTTHP